MMPAEGQKAASLSGLQRNHSLRWLFHNQTSKTLPC
jgi:hypothetical protein